MENKQYSIFDPKNPIFLSFARWVVILTSGIVIFLGFVGLASDSFIGFLVIIGGILNYFTGMIFVNMLYNIRDIKLNTKKTADLLEKQFQSYSDESAF